MISRALIALSLACTSSSAALAFCEKDDAMGVVDSRFEALSLDYEANSIQDWSPHMISFTFNEFDSDAYTSRCTYHEQVHYEKYKGHAWLIKIPTEATGHLISISEILSSIEQRNDDYTLVGNTLLNIRSGDQISIQYTIKFFLNSINFIKAVGGYSIPNPKLLISAPYWKNGSSGPEALGFLKVSSVDQNGDFVPKNMQPYRSFSAANVVCGRKGGLSLITKGMIHEKLSDSFNDMAPGSQGPESSESENVFYNYPVLFATETADCQFAFQAGPAYWEPNPKNPEETLPGVSGLSLSYGRRSVIFMTNDGTRDHTYILTTMSEMTPFDTMILLKGIAEAGGDTDVDEAGAQTLKWAVGIQDRAYLSGPILLSDGGVPTRLTESTMPTGAILVFSDPKEKE